MLRPRIIPCLLIQNDGLVKTRNFKEPKYVGDPINAVRIFNEKEVDEIMVIDIDASVRRREPNLEMIKNLAAECRMPLCYGGGVKTIEQVERIISLGVEKVAMSSAAVDAPDILTKAAVAVGSQSIVVVIDVKKDSSGNTYGVFTHNGKRGTRFSPLELARVAEQHGAGELVVNSIDRDGMMTGYDLELAAQVRDSVSLPMTILGGAGSLSDIAELIRAFGTVGAAAGSLFVFKGRLRAVLISYPNRDDKDTLIAGAMREQYRRK